MKQKTLHLTLGAAIIGGGILAFASSVGAQAIGVQELERMLVPTTTKIERGGEVYDNQCASCHGPAGKGGTEYPAEQFNNPVPDFTQAQYRHGGGPIQVYNVITEGLPEGKHPTFPGVLRYQERWAVTHYVRSLGPTDDLTDPPEVVQKAKVAAKEGRCSPQVMTKVENEIGQFLKPKGDEQIQRGKKLYTENGCQACHGAEGKVNDAMKNLEIPPRNFRSKDAEWYKGANPLAIFNTLTNGARGQMRGYANSITPEDRWALAHFLLEEWVPKEVQSKTTKSDLRGLCRQRSAPDPPAPMTEWEKFATPNQAIDYAMKRVAADAPEDRRIRVTMYGPVKVAPGANADRGEAIFETQCASCHGEGLQGTSVGPYAVRRVASRDKQAPRLGFKVRSLARGHAGGTYEEFASRVFSGVHGTLPAMTTASMLTQQEWKDLQAYIAKAEGKAEVKYLPATPEAVEKLEGENGEADGSKDGETGAEGSEQPAEGEEQPAEDTQSDQ